MHRRFTTALVVAFGVLLFGITPALAQSSADAGGPEVVIDSPRPASQAVPSLPLAPARTPTVLPAIGIVAGLLVLGATLAHISLRRRAALVLDYDLQHRGDEVLILHTRQTVIKGASPAPLPTSSSH